MRPIERTVEIKITVKNINGETQETGFFMSIDEFRRKGPGQSMRQDIFNRFTDKLEAINKTFYNFLTNPS
jgi:hypothetical protein